MLAAGFTKEYKEYSKIASSLTRNYSFQLFGAVLWSEEAFHDVAILSVIMQSWLFNQTKNVIAEVNVVYPLDRELFYHIVCDNGNGSSQHWYESYVA